MIEQVRRAWGLTLARFLRPDRDDDAGRQHARPAVVAGLDGPAAAGLPHRAARCRRPGGRRGRDRASARSASARADARLSGRRRATSVAIGGDFYRTGDIATRDAEGYITYVGRADDVFKSSDYRISPFELESALIEHPAVAEAAVVPAPDPMRLACPRPTSCWPPGHAPDRATALGDLRLPARAPGALQARPAHRVRRTAEDDLRQDPPRRAARARGRAGGEGRAGRGRVPRGGFSGAGVGRAVFRSIHRGRHRERSVAIQPSR